MVRKIISLLLLLTVSMSFSYSVFSEFSLDSYYQTELETAREGILDTPKGEEYKKQIDTFFEKHGDNIKVMQKLDKNLWEAEDAIYFKPDSLDKQVSAVIIYLRANLNIILEDIRKKEEKILEEKRKQRIEEVL